MLIYATSTKMLTLLSRKIDVCLFREPRKELIEGAYWECL